MISDTGSATERLTRRVVGLLLVIHGLIHLLGPLEIWGIADLAELSGRPTVDFGQSATELLAAGWLVAFIALIGAGIGVLTRHARWRAWAIVGVVISQTVIVIWWGEAAPGTIPNLLVIVAVLFSGRWNARSGIRLVEARAA